MLFTVLLQKLMSATWMDSFEIKEYLKEVSHGTVNYNCLVPTMLKRVLDQALKPGPAAAE